MKKKEIWPGICLLLIAVVAGLMMIVACEQTKTEIQQHQAELADEIYNEWTNINKPKIYLFTYKGHDMVYITLHEGFDHAVGGFFHDPECRKCKVYIEEKEAIEVPKASPEELSEYEKMFGKH